MTNFLWYTLPVLFGFVGYVIVSNSLAYDNKIVVKNSFKIAIISSCFWGILIICWLIIFSYSD